MNNFLSVLVFFLFLLSSQSIFSQNTVVDQNLQIIATQEGLAPADVSDYVINNTHRSKRSDLNHFYLLQRFDGIEIYETQSSIHTRTDNSLFRYNSAFLSDIAGRISTTSASLSHSDAIQRVIESFGYDDSQLPSETENMGGREEAKIFAPGSISLDDIPIKLMYYQTDAGQLRLCYDLIINETDYSDWWSLKVDANTGEIVDQVNWVVECNFDHDNEGHHICTDDHTCTKYTNKQRNTTNLSSMTGSYNVFAEPVESPNHGSRSIIADPSDPIASPFGWHDTDGVDGPESTLTVGNNVNAQEDENGNNGNGFSPDGGANLVFDFPVDFTLPPADSREASLTNLFYWNNLTHDIWYQYGFDEGAGNFQENNYGNGGAGSDRVNADGLDGSGTNNANFATPTDGGNPRMQMFLWSPGAFTNTEINSPAAISGNINGVAAGFGPSNFDVTADIVLADDGSNDPTLACDALVNTGAVNNNIALIDRGTCQFGTKVLNAENAGAIAVIVCQNSNAAPFSMAPGANGNQVTIPSIMISMADCNVIKNNLPGVNMSIESVNNNVEIDGSFDNAIIGHEYGHGISIRLTGGANNSNCLNNQEQMGEGWSDWIGLMMTIEPNDVGTSGRGVGTYAISQSPAGGGIRDFPYSTDLSVDPRTYTDISSSSVPHGVGSVWCAMLWEMTWALIAKHGFDPDLHTGTGGNNIAMALVTEGLKLQPCSPGFVDGRDAILAADQAIYGGENECIIWEAFAKRGLGIDASQGSTFSVNDGNESFDVPATCPLLDITKTVDKPSVVAGDILTYTLTYDNQSAVDYTNLTITDELESCLTYVAGSATNGATFNDGVVSLNGVTVSPFSTFSFSFQAEVDPTLTSISQNFLDDAESGTSNWVLRNEDIDLAGWVIDPANPFQGTNSWFAENQGTRNNKLMTIRLTEKLTATSQLRFWHTYNTASNIDGGIVQISIDNQETWSDLDANFIQNGYDNFIDNDPTTPAFGGTNNTTYIESIADLNSFAGENAFIRFIMVHDGQADGTGWNIDDIEITNTEKTVSNSASFTANPNLSESVNIFPPTDIIPATCNDGIQNGTETGVDTGGSCTTGGPCDFDLILSGDPAPGGTYQVQNQITSTANVSVNTDYFASCILLENDFEVVIGTEFLAEINPCTPFNNDGELGLNVVSTGTTNNQQQTVIDVNIPESGEYTLQLIQDDGTMRVLPTQNFAKGVHRITVETEAVFIPNKIEMIKK